MGTQSKERDTHMCRELIAENVKKNVFFFNLNSVRKYCVTHYVEDINKYCSKNNWKFFKQWKSIVCVLSENK